MSDTSKVQFLAVGRGGGIEQRVMVLAGAAKDADILGQSGPANAGAIGCSADGRHVFVGSGIAAEQGQPSGGVQAILRDPESNEMQLLNVEPTQGTTVVSTAVHPRFPMVACANFRLFGRFGGEGAGSRGSVSIHRYFEDGSISPVMQRLEFKGSSVHPERQTNSHPHMSGFDPSGRWLCTADLGIDRVLLNRVADDGSEVELQEKRIEAPEGSGPRHFVFHPEGQWLFVLTEMSGEVLVFRFDPESGSCELAQKISARKENGDGGGAADIRFDAAHNLLAASMRRGEFVSLFRFEEGDEPLRKLGHEPIGPNPRSILLTGGYLFAPAIEDAGLGCWAVQEDGSLDYLYHQPAIPAFNAATTL